MVFHLLKFPLTFEFLLLPPLLPPSAYYPRPCVLVCVVHMPRLTRPRESLDSVKTRLALELKNRIEKRVRGILSPRTVVSQEEIFDDSEEDDRLESRRLRRSREQEGRTDSSSSVVSWRVVVVLFVVLLLVVDSDVSGCWLLRCCCCWWW